MDEEEIAAGQQFRSSLTSEDEGTRGTADSIRRRPRHRRQVQQCASRGPKPTATSRYLVIITLEALSCELDIQYDSCRV